MADAAKHSKSFRNIDLDRLLLEAVDDTISELLGEGVKKALYDYLEKNSSLKKDEIPKRLDDFRLALQEVAGTASKVMERAIAKKVYTRLGLSFLDKAAYTLSDFVKEARTRIREGG